MISWRPSRRCVLHDETRGRLGDRIAILNDDDFAWFVRYGLCIQARNVLDDDGSKRSRNLWYEETLPPDTVMYALVMGRSDGVLETLDTLFPETDPYLQVGGNETVGQGWFAVRVRRGGCGGGGREDHRTGTCGRRPGAGRRTERAFPGIQEELPAPTSTGWDPPSS